MQSRIIDKCTIIGYIIYVDKPESMEMLQMKKEKFNTEENENEKGPENHTVLGMCFGMVAGSVAMSILAMFGQILWGGMCIAAGLFLGALIGAAIPKKKQTNSCLPGKPKESSDYSIPMFSVLKRCRTKKPEIFSGFCALK